MCLDKNLLKTSQSVTLIRIQCFIICVIVQTSVNTEYNNMTSVT